VVPENLTVAADGPAAVAVRVQPKGVRFIATAVSECGIVSLSPRVLVARHNTVVSDSPASFTLAIQPERTKIASTAGAGCRIVPLPLRVLVAQYDAVITSGPAPVALCVQPERTKRLTAGRRAGWRTLKNRRVRRRPMRGRECDGR